MANKAKWPGMPARIKKGELIEAVLRSDLSPPTLRRVVLAVCDVSQSDIADEAGVTRQMVGRAFDFNRSSTVEGATERMLGIPRHRLWPEHYAKTTREE